MDAAQYLFDQVDELIAKGSAGVVVEDKPYTYILRRTVIPARPDFWEEHNMWTVAVSVAFRSGTLRTPNVYQKTANWSERVDGGPLTVEWIRGSIVALRQVLDEALDGEGRV